MSKPTGVISYADTTPMPKKTDGTAVSRSAPSKAGKTSPRSNGAANLRTKQQTFMASRTAAKGKVRDDIPAEVDRFKDHLV